MVNGFIDIHKLNMDELNGVISLYPWFGAARAELCRRMSELGEGAWSDERYADAALYVASRRIIAEFARKGHETEYADADIKELLRAYIEEGKTEEKVARKASGGRAAEAIISRRRSMIPCGRPMTASIRHLPAWKTAPKCPW